jgi:DNA recombination protein RmuC
VALVISLALLTAGCLLGVGLTWLHLQGRLQHATRVVQAEHEAERAALAERLRGREAELQELRRASLRAPELGPLLAEQAGLPES